MKSIAQQFCETQDALIASGKFTADSIKEAVKEAVNEEHRLSILKSLMKKNAIKESVEIRESRQRIERKNGSAIREADGNFTAEEKRIESRMIVTGATYREAHCYVTGKALPVGTKEPAKFTEARLERLKKTFKGAVISEQDFAAMASRQIEP